MAFGEWMKKLTEKVKSFGKKVKGVIEKVAPAVQKVAKVVKDAVAPGLVSMGQNIPGRFGEIVTEAGQKAGDISGKVEKWSGSVSDKLLTPHLK